MFENTMNIQPQQSQQQEENTHAHQSQNFGEQSQGDQRITTGSTIARNDQSSAQPTSYPHAASETLAPAEAQTAHQTPELSSEPLEKPAFTVSEQTKAELQQILSSHLGAAAADIDDPCALLHHLCSAHQALEKNPEQALNYLADCYGLTAVASAPEAVIADEVTTKTLADIYALSEQKDEKGQAKFPHFEKLKDDMILQLQSGKASSAESAYENALWQNAEFRQQALGEMKQTLLAELCEQQKQAEAEIAHASNLKTSGAFAGAFEGAVKQNPKSLRDTLNSIYETHYGDNHAI